MSDFVRIIDADGVEHLVNKDLISEVADSPSGCILFACGHAIRTAMEWNEVIDALDRATTSKIYEYRKSKDESTCKTQ